jgi:hypothetical protein
MTTWTEEVVQTLKGRAGQLVEVSLAREDKWFGAAAKSYLIIISMCGDDDARAGFCRHVGKLCRLRKEIADLPQAVQKWKGGISRSVITSTTLQTLCFTRAGWLARETRMFPGSSPIRLLFEVVRFQLDRLRVVRLAQSGFSMRPRPQLMPSGPWGLCILTSLKVHAADRRLDDMISDAPFITFY